MDRQQLSLCAQAIQDTMVRESQDFLYNNSFHRHQLGQRMDVPSSRSYAVTDTSQGIELHLKAAGMKSDDFFLTLERLAVILARTVAQNHNAELRALNRRVQIPSRPFPMSERSEWREKFGMDYEIPSSREIAHPLWILAAGSAGEFELMYPGGFGRIISGVETGRPRSYIATIALTRLASAYIGSRSACPSRCPHFSQCLFNKTTRVDGNFKFG